MRRGAALLVAVVAGVVAATGAAVVRESSSPEPSAVRDAAQERGRSGEIVSDRLDDVVTGLRTSSFYVSPELQDEVTPADRAAVERELASAPVPTYLVYWTATTEAGYGNTQYGALDALLPRLGSDARPARLALVTEERSALVANIGERTTYADQNLLGGRLGPGLLRYADALAAEETEPPYDRGEQDGALDGGDYWGGLFGGTLAGLLFAGAALAVLVVLVALAAVLLRRARPLEDE